MRVGENLVITTLYQKQHNEKYTKPLYIYIHPAQASSVKTGEIDLEVKT